MIPTLGRFWAKVRRTGVYECWPWTGQLTRDGYGSFWNGERRPGPSRSPVTVLAHRWIYEHTKGPIPDGYVVRHGCDNPPCVNPTHLIADTQRNNVYDCIAKGRHRNGRRVLTEAERQVIREDYKGRYGDLASLARRFGVGKRVIADLVRDMPRTGRLAR